jgi:hypothetical protein
MRQTVTFTATRRLRPSHVAILTAALLLTAGSISAQGQGKKASEVYKNLKVMQDTPAESLNQSMHLIGGQLGVNCEFCHVDQKWEEESVKNKDVARDMMRMTNDINKNAFKGEQVVTCYTCHQGNPEPTSVPRLPAPPDIEEKKPETGLPTVADVLSKYVAALGGEANIRKVTSRVITAQQDIPLGPGGVKPTPATIEIVQKAPNLMVRTAKTKDVTLMNGVDVKGAWVQDARGRVNSPIAFEELRERRANDMYEALNLAKEYKNLKVEGTEKIGGVEAWKITGEFAPDAPISFYFDKKTGLLVRRYTLTPTQAGHSPFQIDYSDYRASSNGVKYPYTMKLEPAGPRTEIATHSTIKILKLQENVPVEDAKLVRPVSKDDGGKKKKQ